MQNNEIDADQIDILIGANLKKMRLERDLSIQLLAEALGVSYQQVQKYEQGVNRIASSTLYSASLFLNVNIGDFYDGVTTLIEKGQVEVDMPDPKEKTMLIFYRKIGKIDQHHVFNIIKSLAQSYKRDVSAELSGGGDHISDKDKL